MQSKKQELEERLLKISELERNLTFRLHILSKRLDQQVIDLLKDAPINLSAYRFLRAVESLGHGSIADMARFIEMDRALASRTAVDLERAGFVEFQKSEKNRRKKFVALSPSGMRLLEELNPRFHARREGMRNMLGEDGFVALHNCLDRLEAFLES